MDRLAIAVAGAGVIGRRHVALIGASDRCALSAIVDPSESASAYARDLGVPHFRDLRALLDRAKPDGIVLATPNALHVEQGLQCLAAGVPALIEKPVAHTLEAGLRLAEAAARSKTPMLVGHHRSYSATIARAAEVIGSGVLGRIVAVTGTSLFYKPESYFDGPYAWRREPGGGPVLINMIHEVGNLRTLVGEIAEVHAFGSSATRGFPVEDTAAMVLRFENGALGTFVLSDAAASDRNWEHTSGEDRVSFGAARTDEDDCYLVCGTWGSLAIPTLRLQRYLREEDRSWHEPLDKSVVAREAIDPLAAQIAHFCDVLRGRAEPRVSVRDGLRNLRVVDAIHESVRTGRTVRIGG